MPFWILNTFKQLRIFSALYGNYCLKWGEKMPLVAMVKDNLELSSTYRRQKLPRSFAEMERHGLRITSWDDQVG
jgi:hypothetical protein